MGDELVLDSHPVLAAVLAAKTFGARHELRMLEAIQHANYVEARHVVRAATLLELAAELGLDGERFASELARAPVTQHVGEARRLMAQTGTGGYPAAFVERDSRALLPVAPQESLGQPEHFVQRLRAAVSE
jgi:putative protein-disulfide isomerase